MSALIRRLSGLHDAFTVGAKEGYSSAMSVDRFPIEAGHVLMFARAIGGPNPVDEDADVGGEAIPRVDP
jgi:hypothetical protein